VVSSCCISFTINFWALSGHLTDVSRNTEANTKSNILKLNEGGKETHSELKIVIQPAKIKENEKNLKFEIL
jgi:hypothetical protein